MALALQIATFVIIVIIGFLSFTYFPIVINTKNITLTAMLVVLSVALQFFSLMIPLFGFPSFRVGFSQLPLMVVGVLLGPSWAFVAGIIQDILGLILIPTGFPFFGFMLNKVLIAMIPAVVFLTVKKLDHKNMHHLVLSLLSLFMIGALWYVFSNDQLIVENNIIEITTTIKWSVSIVIVVLISSLMVFVKLAQDAQHLNKVPVSFWTLSVLLVEVIVTLVLTPTWLYAMYEIPVMLSFLVRVVKSAVMVPLMMFVGYGLLNIIVKNRAFASYLKK